MVNATLGLLATKPGTALGGRSRSQQQRGQDPPAASSAPAASKRDRSMLSQVHLNSSLSNVSDIPDYDIFSHTPSEVRRNDEARRREAEEERSVASNPFAGIDDARSQASGRMFTSDAANAYYSAMKLNPAVGGKAATGGGGRAATPGSVADMSGTVLRGKSNLKQGGKKKAGKGPPKKKKQLDSVEEKKEAVVKKSEGKQLQSAQPAEAAAAAKGGEDKSKLERLIAEALTVAKTPEQVAQYLLAQSDDDVGGTDKMTLYAAIVSRQKEIAAERQQRDEEESRGKKKASFSPELDKGRKAIPPVTSLDCSDDKDLRSTASSITHQTGGTARLAGSVCSVATEAVPLPSSPRDTPRRSRGGAKKLDPATKDPNAKSSGDDPPIAEYPSPVCSPNDDDDALGYPEMATGVSKGNVPDKLKLFTIDDSVEEGNVVPKKASTASAAKKKSFKESIAELQESIEHDLASYAASLSAIDNPAGQQEVFGTYIFEEVAMGVRKMNDNDSSTDTITRSREVNANDNPAGQEEVTETNVFEEVTKGVRKMNDNASNNDTITRSREAQEKKNTVTSKVRSMSPMIFMKKKNIDGDSGASIGQGSASSAFQPVAKKECGGGSNPVSDSSTAASSSSPMSWPSDVNFASANSAVIPSADEEPAEGKSSAEKNSSVVGSIRAASPVVMANKLKNKIKGVGGKDNAEARECIAAASSSPGAADAKKLTKNGGSKKSSPLPPRIPSRAVVPVDPPQQQDMQHVVTSSDDDGSVECSFLEGSEDGAVANNSEGGATGVGEMLQLGQDGLVVVTNIENVVSDGDGAKKKAVTTSSMADDGSVEVSTRFKNDGNNDKSQSDAASAADSKTKKKSRMALAREKLAKHQPAKSPEVEDDKKQRGAAMKAMMSSEHVDDATITSYASNTSKLRKKERLQQIMNYRKKAKSPPLKKNLPQRTLDEWLVAKDKTAKKSDKKKSKDDELREAARVELLDLLKKEKEANNKAHLLQGTNSAVSGDGTSAPKTEEGSASNPPTEPGTTTSAAESKTEKARSQRSNLPEEDDEANETTVQTIVSADPLAPVKQIHVYPNAPENDRDGDVSLPPELLKGKKVRIWHEDVDSHQESGIQQRVNTDDEMLADKCMTCGEGIRAVGLADLDLDNITFDINTTNDEDGEDTIVDSKGAKKSPDGDTNDNSSSKKSKGRYAAFACGIDPDDIKNELIYEVKEVVKDVKQGVRKSMRNLFGACDITREGGIDVVAQNVGMTNDQLHGRAPVPVARPAASRDTNPTDANPQAEKITNILDGTEEARKQFENATRFRKEQEEEVQLKAKGVKKPTTIADKQRLYLEKLKAISMKHL